MTFEEIVIDLRNDIRDLEKLNIEERIKITEVQTKISVLKYVKRLIEESLLENENKMVESKDE